MYIPPTYYKLFPEVFPRESTGTTHTVTPTRPVLLSQIILVAQSQAAYDLSRADTSELESFFADSQRIIRQGCLYAFSLDNSRYSYEAALCEPVLQGYAATGHTRFLVMLGETRDELSALDDLPDDAQEYFSDPEPFEIDEGFLASSINRSFPAPTHMPLRHRLNSDASDAGTTASSVGQGGELAIQIQSLGSSLTAKTLREPVQVDGELGDEGCNIFARTADLGRIGIFNGHWV